VRFSLPLLLIAGALVALPLPALAQSAPSVGTLPTLPRMSPRAEVQQTVGVTQIRLTWSSPAARDRTIWGDVVAWGEVWRAGADGATKLEVSHDFTFGGVAVPAGTYSIFVRPTAERFTFLLNRDPSGRGAYAYDADEDVASVDVVPTQAPHRERLLYLFDNTTDTTSDLTLEWAGMRAVVSLGVDTPAIARTAIHANLGALWRPPFNAARYYLDSGQDLAQAAEWMADSIRIEENWWNQWFMARIQAERGDRAAARTHAERAIALGGDDPTWVGFFRADAEAALAEWSAE
jgi:hypothetical protein